MLTIIDELVVLLNLDPKGFDEGQKKAADQLKKFGDAAETHNKRAAAETDKATQAFTALQGRLLSIAGLLMGGMGIEGFIDKVTRLTAQTGFLAKSLGVSVTELGKWEAAGATVGASAGDMAQGVATIQRAQAQFQIHGTGPLFALAYRSGQQGRPPINLHRKPDGSWPSPTDVLIDLARNAAAEPNKAVASAQLAEVGLGQGMINMLLLGPQELQKRLKEAEKFAPTAEQTKRLTELQEAFGKLAVSAESLGREIVSKLEPALSKVFKLIEDSVDKLPNIDETTLLGKKGTTLRDFYDWEKGGQSNEDLLFGPKNNGTGMNGWVRRKWEGVKNFFSSPPEQSSSGSASGAASQSGAGNSAGTGSSPGSPQPGTSDAPAHVGRTGWWTSDRKQHAVDYLMQNAGLPEVSARAMVARWAGVESTQRGASEVNYIGAQGIAQWLGNRKGGYALGDFDSQLAHVVRELRTTEHRSYATLMKAQDERSAAIGASQYERAEGYNGVQDMFVDKTIRAMRAIPGGSKVATTGASRPAPPSAPHPSDIFWNGWDHSIANLNLGASAALASNPVSTTNTNNSSQTHIGSMNVTVPPGADPVGYANGIRQELQRYDNVMQAQTGLK